MWLHSTTELMMVGRGADVLVEKAFQAKVKNGMAILPGVVSREKADGARPHQRHQAGGSGRDGLTAFVPTMKNRTPRPFSNGRGVLLSFKGKIQAVSSAKLPV